MCDRWSLANGNRKSPRELQHVRLLVTSSQFIFHASQMETLKQLLRFTHQRNTATSLDFKCVYSLAVSCLSLLSLFVLQARYTDPKTKLRYHSAKQFDTIQQLT